METAIKLTALARYGENKAEDVLAQAIEIKDELELLQKRGVHTPSDRDYYETLMATANVLEGYNNALKDLVRWITYETTLDDFYLGGLETIAHGQSNDL